MSEAWKIKLKEQKKWKLLHATDFHSLMYPCTFIANILAVFPFKCVSSRYSYSRIRIIYTTINAIIFTILLLALEYKISFGNWEFSNIPKMIDVQFYLVATGSVVLTAYIQCGGKLRLLQHLLDLSSMLSSKDFNDMAKLIHSKDILIFLFIFIHIFNCAKEDSFMTLRNFTIFLMTMVSFVESAFYMNCVCVLKACFIKVNEDLQQLKRPVNQTFLRHGQGTAQLLIKLKSLEGKHIQIIDVLQLLNKTFLVHIVVTTITTFTIITFNLYFYILLINGGEGSSNTTFWYVRYLGPIMYYFLQYTMVIWACETATNQAERLRTTLHDVLSEATDLLVKREVELFSLQLLHHETSFCVKTFKLNTVLLIEIVEDVNMYMLILIQFLLNSVVCSFKNH